MAKSLLSCCGQLASIQSCRREEQEQRPDDLANENCRQYGTEQFGAKAFEWFAVKSARMAGATLVLICPSGAC